MMTREEYVEIAESYINLADCGTDDRKIASRERRAQIYATLATIAPPEPTPATEDAAMGLLVALVSEWQAYCKRKADFQDATFSEEFIEAFAQAEAFVREAAEKAGTE
jgi:hypothetical protein